MPASLAKKSRPRELGIPERETLCRVVEEQIFTEIPMGGEINTRQKNWQSTATFRNRFSRKHIQGANSSSATKSSSFVCC